MQFVWKYVDDLVGKGLEWYVIAELMFYASASFVPMALPLAILLSSIMAFGNFGENSELTACKASGISLQRVMLPLIFVSILMSGVAFYFSNYVLPVANLKFGSLLYDVRQQKPAFALKAGMFYTGLEGYSIKVESIDKDGQTLNNIMVYDHTDNLGNIKLITAKTGFMKMSKDHVMTFALFDGNIFDETKSRSEGSNKTFQRTSFKESLKRFDMSAYSFQRTDEELFKDNYQMLNLEQLRQIEDTTKQDILDDQIRFDKNIQDMFLLKHDSLVQVANYLHPIGLDPELKEKNFIQNFPVLDRARIIEMASAVARGSKQTIASHLEEISYRNKSMVKYNIEFHRKFTLSIACIILFFIGAPLGAIIRKGGLGMPVFMATIFFVIYHLFSISGEKFSKEGMLEVYQGMWLASAVMLPMGFFLTIMATTDSALLDVNAYLTAIKKPFLRKKA